MLLNIRPRFRVVHHLCLMPVQGGFTMVDFFATRGVGTEGCTSASASQARCIE